MVERVVTQVETYIATGDAGEDEARSTMSVGPITPAGAARYEQLGEIGRGGMATVHRVRDRSLLRTSAMKIIAPRLSSRRGAAERFLREARITAQLDHPNIVPVHELGTNVDGDLYFTMKRVEGRTLEQWSRELNQPSRDPEDLRSMLEAYLKVCDAVAFAHSRGVIHCDIKPSNVMVGDFGQVYLMDWGVAQVLGEEAPPADHAPTAGARAAGTPSFMSPEQATDAALDERTDVFGLGALLHAILTGEPPFPGDDSEAILSQARASLVARPAAPLAPLPERLRQISLRAMAREKSDRYPGAADLKKDVEAALRKLPLLRWEVHASGDRIVVEGEPGDCAYVLVSGSCVAYKTDPDGRRVVLRRLGAGAVFGETAVLSGGVRTATVEAEDEVTVSVVSRRELEQNLGLGTPFGAFVVALADRFRELDSRASARGGT